MNFSDEVSIEIFKQICFPAALSRVNRYWLRISRDPHAKVAWLIAHHGKAHALFHAVRLGNDLHIDLQK